MSTQLDTQKDQLPLGIVQKATRLCVATYKLTDFMDPGDPARNHLRDLGAKLVRSSMSYTNSHPAEPRKTIKDITDNINLLMSFYKVLGLTDIISRTNEEIMRTELLSFMELVENYFKDRFGILFALSDFLEKAELPALHQSSLKVGVAGGEHYPEARVMHPPLKEHGDLQNVRQSRILDFIRGHGPSTIRDVVTVVKGCSEKTIQRELTSLINAGFVRREGERRWSKYLVVQQN